MSGRYQLRPRIWVTAVRDGRSLLFAATGSRSTLWAAIKSAGHETVAASTDSGWTLPDELVPDVVAILNAVGAIVGDKTGTTR